MAYRFIGVSAYMPSLYQEYRRKKACLTIRYDLLAIGIFEFVRKRLPVFLSAPRPVIAIRLGDGAGRYGDTPDGQRDGTERTARRDGLTAGGPDETGTSLAPLGVSRSGAGKRLQCRLLAINIDCFCVRFAISVYINEDNHIIVDTENYFAKSLIGRRTTWTERQTTPR